MLKYFKLFARNEDDSSELAFQKMLIMFIAFIMNILGVVWGLIYSQIYGWGSIVVIAFTYSVILTTTIIISHLLKNHYILIHVLFVITVALPASIQFIIGDLEYSGMVISWCFMGALGSLIFLSVRQAIYWMIVFLGIVIYTVNFDPAWLGYKLEVSHGISQLQYNMNIIASYTVIFVAAAWFVKTFQFEKERSERLLLNILPKDVAEELKTYGRVEPVSHEDATVLFTDFKGFTEISGSITPKELVEEINHCFGAFDDITTKYNIEKIKTVGDSYMAVGATFSNKICKPWQVVKAGIEMQEYMKQRKVEREKEGKFFFEMRAGIHTGDVIAGIVGVKKFQYDIWGDTVNTASRMETYGEIGQVNISQYTYEIIKDNEHFKFTRRGQIQVKGKGAYNMWFAELNEKYEANKITV